MREQKRLGNKGFSLVELIVVIAIMAILIAVIAPTLISKIEDSRESTDLSTVGEVRTQIVNMLADEEIYKELVDKDKTTDYTVSNKCVITGGDDVDAAQAELKEVIGEFEFKSSAAEGKSITVRIDSKGKVYAFVEGETAGQPATISDGVLAAGSEIDPPAAPAPAPEVN